MYGDGKAIIEILSIGFEPLMFEDEYDTFIKYKNYRHKREKYKVVLNKIDKLNKKYEDRQVCVEKTLLHNLMNFYVPPYEKNKNKCDMLKSHLKDQLNANMSKIRTLVDDREWGHDQYRNISIFESDLTRCFGCEDMQHTDDIISVTTYYTEIFDNIMHNGFIYKDKKYVFFTAGAGQTRNKKSTFTEETKLNQNMQRLFCGLTREHINKLGGMNTNKYLAYTSLCQSNTSIWKSFDIDRAIVVPDIEFEIPNQEVRRIYTETPDDKIFISENKESIDKITATLREMKEFNKTLAPGTRRNKKDIQLEKSLRTQKKWLQEQIKKKKSEYHKTSITTKSVKIPFTDGFGIMFKQEPNAMVRMPFMKGLLSYISRNKFKQYCKKDGLEIREIEDIYGKKHSIDDVDYIFTESQFKMHKYYENVVDDNGNVIKTGWEVYKEYFKQYGCTANRCNIEKKNKKLNAKTNYQVLQTLTTEMTDKDITSLAEYDIDNLNGIGKDLQCMLNVLGADESRNEELNDFQKSLLLYPEMFKDYYVKTLLKNTKDSMIKKLYSGKFNVNGAYTFIVPEPLACLQWWFLGQRDLEKLGLLKKNQVACKLFDDNVEVDCLRSPHLDHAHCIRTNVKTEETLSWYNTNALYVGVNDIMSKLLMYDNDGDTALVHNNKTIIKCAKSYQKKYKMIPNDYDMPKANPQQLNEDTLFGGIVMAYHHGNIGTPSNEITKVFDTLNPQSSESDVKEAIEIVALRCCDVNYVIDYAKTLYKPEIPKEVEARYKAFSKRKVPNFFIYAKDKTKVQVEEPTQNNINRIQTVVKKNKIVFNDVKVLGSAKFQAKMMMYDQNVEYSNEDADRILSLYRELETAKLRYLKNMDFDSCDVKEKQKVRMLLQRDSLRQREMFAQQLGLPKEYICDVLIKLLKNDANKDTLWKLFGDIIYSNLSRNLDKTKRCTCCGIRFEYKSNRSKYCEDCAKQVRKEQKASSERARRK